MAMVVQMHEGVAINKFKLDKPLLRIGRDPASDIFIDNTVVSNEHAVIKTEDRPEPGAGVEFYVEDLNSTNGTLVNGVGFDRHLLKHGDKIQVGKHTFIFDSGQGDMEETAIYLPDNE